MNKYFRVTTTRSKAKKQYKLGELLSSNIHDFDPDGFNGLSRNERLGRLLYVLIDGPQLLSIRDASKRLQIPLKEAKNLIKVQRKKHMKQQQNSKTGSVLMNDASQQVFQRDSQFVFTPNSQASRGQLFFNLIENEQQIKQKNRRTRASMKKSQDVDLSTTLSLVNQKKKIQMRLKEDSLLNVALNSKNGFNLDLNSKQLKSSSQYNSQDQQINRKSQRNLTDYLNEKQFISNNFQKVQTIDKVNQKNLEVALDRSQYTLYHPTPKRILPQSCANNNKKDLDYQQSIKFYKISTSQSVLPVKIQEIEQNQNRAKIYQKQNNLKTRGNDKFSENNFMRNNDSPAKYLQSQNLISSSTIAQDSPKKKQITISDQQVIQSKGGLSIDFQQCQANPPQNLQNFYQYCIKMIKQIQLLQAYRIKMIVKYQFIKMNSQFKGYQSLQYIIYLENLLKQKKEGQQLDSNDEQLIKQFSKAINCWISLNYNWALISSVISAQYKSIKQAIIVKKFNLIKQMMIMKVVKTPGVDNDDEDIGGNKDIKIAYNDNFSTHQQI